MQTSPFGQVRHVMFGRPQCALIGWHEGVVTVAHVTGVQHVPS
jgi:hypothetical protein